MGVEVQRRGIRPTRVDDVVEMLMMMMMTMMMVMMMMVMMMMTMMMTMLIVMMMVVVVVVVMVVIASCWDVVLASATARRHKDQRNTSQNERDDRNGRSSTRMRSKLGS